MTFEEFESCAQKALMAFIAVRDLVHENPLGKSMPDADRRRIEQLQEEAAIALGTIDHIIDRFGNRTCVFGTGDPEVDMFRESLSVSNSIGSAILDTSIAELRLLRAKLLGRVKNLSDCEINRLLGVESVSARSDGAPRPTASEKQIDVFVSYSTEDREIAEDLTNRLRALQLTVFMAHDTITTGPTWRSQVGIALRRCTVAVLLLSNRSLQSDWVRYEMGAIWALNKPAAPALIDCNLSQLPELVRDFQARAVPTAADRAFFCHEVERLVRETRTNGNRSV